MKIIQHTIPSVRVIPSHYIVFKPRVSWMATRFGLKRNKRKEKELEKTTRVINKPINDVWGNFEYIYELATLETGQIELLLEQLEKNKLEYKIID